MRGGPPFNMFRRLTDAASVSNPAYILALLGWGNRILKDLPDTDQMWKGPWKLTPWWCFWRPKWHRRVFTFNRDQLFVLDFATDEQYARQFLEATFDKENQAPVGP